jgi:hypothetical protein
MARLLLCFLLYAVVIIVSISTGYAQSPWVRSRAGFFVQAAWQMIPAYTQLFGEAGTDIELERAVTERSLQFYGEYGLSRHTTVVLTLPLVFNQRGDSNPDSPNFFAREEPGKLAGLGNIQLALRHQISKGRVAFSGTLRVGLPATRYQSNTGLRTGLDALTITPMLSAGMGFRKAYCFAYADYGWRSNHYSAFAQTGLEAGYHPGRFWLIGFTEFTGSLKNGAQHLPAQDVLTGLYVNDQQWWSVGFKTLVALHRFWGLSASVTGAAWGQYVPEKPAFSLGAYFKWD